MTAITVTEERGNLYRLVDEVADSSQPITIAGKRNNAVLIAKKDWSAIQETLYLLSVPSMRESINEGIQTPLNKCAEDLDW